MRKQPVAGENACVWHWRPGNGPSDSIARILDQISKDSCKPTFCLENRFTFLAVMLQSITYSYFLVLIRENDDDKPPLLKATTRRRTALYWVAAHPSTRRVTHSPSYQPPAPSLVLRQRRCFNWGIHPNLCSKEAVMPFPDSETTLLYTRNGETQHRTAKVISL